MKHYNFLLKSLTTHGEVVLILPVKQNIFRSQMSINVLYKSEPNACSPNRTSSQSEGGEGFQEGEGEEPDGSVMVAVLRKVTSHH